MKKIFKYLFSLFLLFSIVSCQSSNSSVKHTFENKEYEVYKNGNYNSKYEVAIYIYYYHELPKNYLTKKEADNHDFSKEWTKENKLSIGGDIFKNREGKLPLDETYTECDIDTYKYNRGAKRIVFSNTFRIYYTSDHYKTFEEILFNA